MFGAHDFTYAASDSLVVTLSLDFDIHWVETFDRSSSVLQAAIVANAPSDLRTVAYDREIMVISSDDVYAYVYVFDAHTHDRGSVKIVALDPAD